MNFSNKDFVHFHCHSAYSRFDSLVKLSNFILEARKMGFPAISLTDHGNIMGWIKFLEECKATKTKKGVDIPYAPIKAILGCEFYLSRKMEIGQYDDKTQRQGMPKQNQPDGRKGNRHLNLYAMNFKGYQNLCTLSQRSWTKGFYFDPRIDIELLSEYSEGIMIGSACLSSVININLLNGNYEKAKKICGVFKEISNDNFFLEVMYHGIPEEKAIIPEIFKLSSDLKIPVVATNDCLVKNTFIHTLDGLKYIQDMKVGDFVFTHNKKYKKVKYFNERKINKNEYIYKIYGYIGSCALNITKNHPIYVGVKQLKKNKIVIVKNIWKKVEDLSTKDYLVIPKILPENIFRELDNNDNLFIDLTKYYNIKRISKKTFKENNQEYIYSGRCMDKNIRIPRYLKVNNDFLMILGLYLAEGHVALKSSQIQFGINIHEKKWENLIKRYFSQFGLNVERKISGSNGGGLSFRIVSGVFSKLFYKLCGCHSNNKKLPVLHGYQSFMGLWSKEKLLKILSVYVEGDGHEPSGRKPMMVASTSSRLINEISMILNSLDILSLPTVRLFQNGEIHKKWTHKNPNANFNNWNNLYCLHISGNNKFRFQNLLGRNIEWRGKGKQNYLETDEYYYVKIKKIEKIKHNGNVYNFEVDEDNSYIANHCIVHNCHYIKKSEASSQEVLMLMSTSKCIKDPKRLHFAYNEFYLKSANEMAKIFKHAPHCLYNSVELAERINTQDIEDNLFGGMRLPKFDIPKEFNNSYEYLDKLSWEGLEREGWGKSEKHIEALKKELYDVKIAKDHNNYDFATYFLIVMDYIAKAKELGVLTGAGRGSGYASVLLRCLGITYGLDPLDKNLGLIWERFLGFDEKKFILEKDFGF